MYKKKDLRNRMNTWTFQNPEEVHRVYMNVYRMCAWLFKKSYPDMCMLKIFISLYVKEWVTLYPNMSVYVYKRKRKGNFLFGHVYDIIYLSLYENVCMTL